MSKAPKTPARTCSLCPGTLRASVQGDAHKACLEKKARSEDVVGQVTRRLYDHYYKTFEALRGVKPVFTHADMGACKSAAKNLVPELGEETVKSMMTRCLEQNGTVTGFARDPNRYRGNDPRKRQRPIARQERPVYVPGEGDPWALGGDDVRRH